MVSYPLLIALSCRSLSLLLPQTYFQPDEFYQALEPAHNLVFGYGHLTWEWTDLPSASNGGGFLDLLKGSVNDGERMRGWLWPAVFAGVYKLLALTGLDQSFLLTLAPRIVGVFIAAITDYQTYRLSSKLLGSGSAAAALFLSLTSLFNAHLLPRALSTSPETLLTTAALTYFPFPKPSHPSDIIVGDGKEGLHASKSMSDVTEVGHVNGKGNAVVRVRDVGELDYVVMDNMGEGLEPQRSVGDNLFLSMVLAATAICIRPTTLPFWGYMGTELVVRTLLEAGLLATVQVVFTALTAGFTVLCASTILDYQITGNMSLPIVTFINQNLLQNISSFYGPTNPTYHLVQSLPIMLFPIWWYFSQGYLSNLLPSNLLPKSLSTLSRPAGLRLLTRSLTFSISMISLSPHSEWRFLHPFFPSLLLLALPPLFKAYKPTIFGAYFLKDSIRQYLRLLKFPFYLCLFAPILPYFYLNVWHGAAQVGVMNALRGGELGEVTGVVGLLPCHSIPWMSHLHKNVESWFLTCEPPLGVDPEAHQTQQEIFYANPVKYLETLFPYPPVQLNAISKIKAFATPPSHIIFFGELLKRSGEVEDGSRIMSVKSSLEGLGYREVWRMWNGFDILQDEEERRGGVCVWIKD